MLALAMPHRWLPAPPPQGARSHVESIIKLRLEYVDVGLGLPATPSPAASWQRRGRAWIDDGATRAAQVSADEARTGGSALGRRADRPAAAADSGRRAHQARRPQCRSSLPPVADRFPGTSL